MANLYGGSDHYHIGRVHKNKKWLIITALITGLLLILLALNILLKNKAAAPTSSQQQPNTEEKEGQSLATVKSSGFDSKKLQAVVNDWVKSHKGTYSIVITDPEHGINLVSYKGDTQYFTASIYKLYVAYVGYQKIDDGTYKESEPYLNGWTREKCLDEMIRTSHSPCAEKMWVELGKENLNTQLKKYGLNNTSMTGLYTSAGDAALILTRIQKGQNLSKESRDKLLNSMKKQIYRDGLPAGFKNSATYDKVGFNGKVEYHDTALVKTNKGILVVSVLTKNVGTKDIAGLASAIEGSL